MPASALLTSTLLLLNLVAPVSARTTSPPVDGAAPADDAAGPAIAEVPCWEKEPPCGGAAGDEAGEDEVGTDPRRIEILRAGGRGRPERAEMEAWHRNYDRGMAPVKRALTRLLAAQVGTRPADLGPYCRRLAAAVAAVDREAILPVPDLAADLHLKRALAHLAGTAIACSEASFARTDYHLLETGRALLHLDLALRHYRLGW